MILLVNSGTVLRAVASALVTVKLRGNETDSLRLVVLFRCLLLNLSAGLIFLLPGMIQAQQPTAPVEKLFASGVQA